MAMFDYDDFYADELIGRDEHDAFEQGAEDMERRAMRLEAERDAEKEAAWAALEAVENLGCPPDCPGCGDCREACPEVEPFIDDNDILF